MCWFEWIGGQRALAYGSAVMLGFVCSCLHAIRGVWKKWALQTWEMILE